MATKKLQMKYAALLTNANLDFDSVKNKALNNYLPRIFHNCPFTEDVCIAKQCVECAVFKETSQINEKLRP